MDARRHPGRGHPAPRHPAPRHPAPRHPGQRAGLTKEQVVAAANDVLADGGFGALTMRAVAERLAVAPNALYSHIANKTELVDEVLDATLGEIPAPATDDVETVLREIMAETFTALLRHPDLMPAFLARQGSRGPHARRLGDVMAAALGRVGITGSDAVEARRVLIVYTIGFAAFAAGPPDRNPVPPDELRRNFASGLRWLLAGILSAR
ncbi:helix-turn-helix domain-containing protein [Actinomycetes bacterium KLBMP 9759]